MSDSIFESIGVIAVIVFIFAFAFGIGFHINSKVHETDLAIVEVNFIPGNVAIKTQSNKDPKSFYICLPADLTTTNL